MIPARPSGCSPASMPSASLNVTSCAGKAPALAMWLPEMHGPRATRGPYRAAADRGYLAATTV